MRRVFASTGYGKLFDALVTAEDIERGKPDPMCYLAAAAKLGSEPRRCAVFEDSVAGLKAGRGGGNVHGGPAYDISGIGNTAALRRRNSGFFQVPENLRQCCFRKMGKPPAEVALWRAFRDLCR